MRDSTFMKLMQLLPKSALSTAVGMATRAPAPARLHQTAIAAFVRRYRVAMEEAEQPLTAYPTFGEFFARKLKPGLRPIDAGARVVVSPVDGAVSQAGTIETGHCIQAKGIAFPVAKLLGDPAEAEGFDGGSFATLYLAPRDYHRIHSPLGGEIEGYRYLPGQFWPVNPISVRNKEALFCVNERLVTYLSTAAGRVAVVAVGATCVSRIRAAYDEIVTHRGEPGKLHRYPAPLPILKGEELGLFEMGSTVILLFQRDRVRWNKTLVEEAKVQMGRSIGELA